jgi:hypothetical protein
MKDAKWESLMDGILESLRNNENIMIGIFPVPSAGDPTT